jgi:hypothetical protein
MTYLAAHCDLTGLRLRRFDRSSSSRVGSMGGSFTGRLGYKTVCMSDYVCEVPGTGLQSIGSSRWVARWLIGGCTAGFIHLGRVLSPRRCVGKLISESLRQRCPRGGVNVLSQHIGHREGGGITKPTSAVFFFHVCAMML